MRDLILNFPEQLRVGEELAKDSRLPAGTVKLEREYKRVVVCGMGGSIIPGMILLTYQEHKNKGPGVPVIINNNYGLPSDVSAEDLVICISWSGTTEETISAYKIALERGLTPIVITKGDELGKLAKEKGSPLITLPDEKSPPRLSVGYMTGVLFAILGLQNELDINLDPSILEKRGKELAEKIDQKTPLIYTSYPWRKLGAMWKANINETAKTPAYWNYVPIMAHDELEMYERKNLPFYPLIFQDSKDQPQYLRNLNAAIAIFDELEYNYSIVDLDPVRSSLAEVPIGTRAKGASETSYGMDSSNLAGRQAGKLLETIFNNYILGLWTSYYLAQNLGIDPEDINLIDKFKQLKKEL